MKREYHNKFKYNVVLFYDIALDTDVLIGLFLVGITIITTLVVILNSSSRSKVGKKNQKNTTIN